MPVQRVERAVVLILEVPLPYSGLLVAALDVCEALESVVSLALCRLTRNTSTSVRRWNALPAWRCAGGQGTQAHP